MKGTPMEKETLTPANIAKDLSIVIKQTHSNKSNSDFAYYLFPLICVAIIIGVLLNSVWIGLVISLFPAGFMMVAIKQILAEKADLKKLNELSNQGNISITVEVFSHVANETVLEPHIHTFLLHHHAHLTKTVRLFHFTSGISWRIPGSIFRNFKHYAWSKTHFISTQGLENLSVEGNEFFYVSLQGYPDIAYIYPCKLFKLDKSLTIKE